MERNKTNSSKNNAIEKVENIANSNVNSQKVGGQTAGVNNATTPAFDDNYANQYLSEMRAVSENIHEQNLTASQKRRLIRSQRLELLNSERASKERIKAEKKLELARIRARNRAEKEKAQATALRDKNRRKAQALAKKQQLKEERAKRRETLQHESAMDRRQRKAEERQARLTAVREKRQARLEVRRQRILAEREERRQRRANRQKNREQGRSYGGWLAAVICLGVSTLALASALTVTFLMPQETDLALENAYSRSFYDTVEQVDNIDLNLSKLLASNDNGAKQTYLVDLAINSELAEADIQQLPLKDESKFYTTKLINQIGDYSKYLNKKLIDGGDLSAEDYQNLSQLYRANLSLKETLQAMLAKMGDDFSFTSISEAGSGNTVVNNFNQLQNLSVEYPELIYDGPFSDGQASNVAKGLKGNIITRAEAEDIFKGIFADRGLTEVKTEGSSNGKFECFNVLGKTEKGDIYAEISKTGGKLIMFDCAGTCEDVNYQSEFALKNAQEFLQNIDLNGMEAVWINLSNNVYTINFAHAVNGVVVYPDMVKVRVCAQTGDVIGLEATAYYTNHTQRQIGTPSLSKKTACAKVNPEMQIETVRLCVCPTGINSEKLCYEISGEINDATYYVYIDAITGKQIEMFKVIESTEGTLLM